ncbi:MAG: hypothetical protein GX660_02410 [Clostridiaceae bacterium]|nr:hypothetical protein [Clostridiaceae bacterium]
MVGFIFAVLQITLTDMVLSGENAGVTALAYGFCKVRNMNVSRKVNV